MTTDILITAEQFQMYLAQGVPSRKMITVGQSRFEVQLLQGNPIRITEYVCRHEMPTSFPATLPALPELTVVENPPLDVDGDEAAMCERIAQACADDQILAHIDTLRDRRIKEIADGVRAGGDSPSSRKFFKLWLDPDTRPLNAPKKLYARAIFADGTHKDYFRKEEVTPDTRPQTPETKGGAQ